MPETPCPTFGLEATTISSPPNLRAEADIPKITANFPFIPHFSLSDALFHTNQLQPRINRRAFNAVCHTLTFGQKRNPMKPSNIQIAIFGAIIKSIGIYQLVQIAYDICSIFLIRMNFAHKSVRSFDPGKESELHAWALFHFGLAMVLILCTGLSSQCSRQNCSKRVRPSLSTSSVVQ